MDSILANAPRWDSTQQNLLLVLTCIAAVAVAATMVVLSTVLAGKRRYANPTGLTGVATVWGIIAAGSVIYAAMARLSWQKSHSLELQSGYGDWQELPPPYPWALWGIPAAIYLVVLLWAALGSQPQPLQR
jgi:hypothetical protein